MITRRPKALGFQKLAPMMANRALIGAKTQGIPGQPTPAPAMPGTAIAPRPFGR